MLKNIFKSVIFAAITITCFSNNLKSEEITLSTETIIEKKQNTKNQSLEKDEYIEDFLKTIKDKNIKEKIEYDGENLILYVTPSYKIYVGSLITAILSTSLGIILLNRALKETDEKKGEPYLASAMGSFFVDLLCLISIIQYLYYEKIKTPFLTINNEQIKNWDKEISLWKNIEEVRLYQKFSGPFPAGSLIKLCDKFLNKKIIIDFINFSPIPENNLMAILEHYMEKRHGD